jgi:phytanoyl-CoA hydroxylase
MSDHLTFIQVFQTKVHGNGYLAVMIKSMSTATASNQTDSRPSSTELDALAATYERDGYLNGGAVLSAAELEVLKADLDRVIDQQGRAGVPQPYRITQMGGSPTTPIWQVVDIWLASAAFASLLRNERIMTIAARLLESRSVRLWHDQIQYKVAGGGGVNWWHQDHPYWNVIGPAEEVLTAWIAIDDAGTDNGCMSMVPGSHKLGDNIRFLEGLNDGRRDHSATSIAAAIPAEHQGLVCKPEAREVKAGHVHFHHSYAWHGSHANPSTRPRRAIALHLMSERCVAIGGKVHHLKKPEIPVAVGDMVQGPLFPLCYYGREG